MNARLFVSFVVVSLCVFVGELAGGAVGAGAVVSQFGSSGSEAGQFTDIGGAAVDQATGDVYLYDIGVGVLRVDKFTSEGTFVLAWGWGVADGVTSGLQTCTTTCYPTNPGTDYGPGTGEFGLGPRGLAVDNDPLSPSYEDVYVSDNGNNRVEKFSPSGSFLGMFGKEVNENGGDVCVAGEKCQPGKAGEGSGEFSSMVGAIAVSPTGDVYVGDYERVQEFSPEGFFVAQFVVGGGFTRSVAVDGAGDFYLVSGGEGEPFHLREYDSSGALLRTLDGEGEPWAVTLDASGDLFVDDSLGGHRLLEYAPGGEELASFDTGSAGLDAPRGIAIGDTIGRLYVPNEGVVRLVPAPPPGPELIGNGSVNGIEPLAATLNATVNPEGNATTYRFEYGLTSSYGSSAPSPEGSLPANFNEEPVSATLTKLKAGTTYHYRVVATDSKGHVTTGPDETFTTLSAVLIDSVSVTNVAATSASFEAQLNPLGVDATYRIEYDTSEYAPAGPAHGTSVSEGSLGTGSSDVSVGAHVGGLQPGTLYHYRAVAHDTREGVAYTVYSQDRTFITQVAGGGGLALPDGRQWEMVSPADKLGAQILAIGQYGREGAVIQAAAGGGALAYMTVSPVTGEPDGYTNYNQVFSARGSAGWGSRDIGLHHDSATGVSIGKGNEYRFFSEDLSSGVVQPLGAFIPSLSDEASEQTSYLRTVFTNGDANSPCASSCYRPLVTGMAGHANVPAGTVFGEEGKCPPKLFCGPLFWGATPDLKHVVLTSLASLTSTPTGGERSLYEWSDGSLGLVSVLPGGGAADGEPGLGSSGHSNGESVRRAISGDGSRIVWFEFNGQHRLFMRDMSRGVTVQLDAGQGGSAEGAGVFQIASDDGSRVFFTDERRLTADSGAVPGEPDLYECEMVVEAGELKCILSDLTPVSFEKSFGRVQGVVGASDDGSWVYFVDGTTLYVYHDGTTKTVATLSSSDRSDWGFNGGSGVTARVSSDGHWVAFMSLRELTGYDSHDAVTGKPDEEVYLYDALAAGGAGRVVCASCNPTGARPVGIELGSGSLVEAADGWYTLRQGLAANVPVWVPYGEGVLHQPRYLSDEGRLFFNSGDGLVPQDVNGAEDVYEYEPPGVGGCSTSSVSFGSRSDGCVGLLSSGGSGEESALLDASVSGGDVFFLTTAKLSGADRDTTLDVYDAHVCTTGAACFAVPSVPPPVCDTGDSCKAAPSLQPAVFGAPSSATFSGAGNVVSSGSKTVVRSKGLTRAQKLARALSECRKRRGRQRRAVCVRHARARFARSGSLRFNASGRGGR